jgi:hypothetical protein
MVSWAPLVLLITLQLLAMASRGSTSLQGIQLDMMPQVLDWAFRLLFRSPSPQCNRKRVRYQYGMWSENS